MAIDEKYVALINAAIDGELSPDERSELDAFLEKNAEGRELDASLKEICGRLDAVPELPPPPHLRHVIMEYARPRIKATRKTNSLQGFFSLSSVRLAGAFTLGVILTWTLISSDRIARDAFEEVTGLVGTITDDAVAPGGRTLSVSNNEIAGTIASRLAGPIMIIDFNLVSHEPVEIVAGFSDPDIWFNGFAQLESTGTSVSARAGQVRMTMHGKRRYAVYLHNASGEEATVNLSFYADGALIHEDQLRFERKD